MSFDIKLEGSLSNYFLEELNNKLNDIDKKIDFKKDEILFEAFEKLYIEFSEFKQKVNFLKENPYCLLQSCKVKLKEFYQKYSEKITNTFQPNCIISSTEAFNEKLNLIVEMISPQLPLNEVEIKNFSNSYHFLKKIIELLEASEGHSAEFCRMRNIVETANKAEERFNFIRDKITRFEQLNVDNIEGNSCLSSDEIKFIEEKMEENVEKEIFLTLQDCQNKIQIVLDTYEINTFPDINQIIIYSKFVCENKLEFLKNVVKPEISFSDEEDYRKNILKKNCIYFYTLANGIENFLKTPVEFNKFLTTFDANSFYKIVFKEYSSLNTINETIKYLIEEYDKIKERYINDSSPFVDPIEKWDQNIFLEQKSMLLILFQNRYNLNFTKSDIINLFLYTICLNKDNDSKTTIETKLELIQRLKLQIKLPSLTLEVNGYKDQIRVKYAILYEFFKHIEKISHFEMIKKGFQITTSDKKFRMVSGKNALGKSISNQKSRLCMAAHISFFPSLLGKIRKKKSSDTIDTLFLDEILELFLSKEFITIKINDKYYPLDSCLSACQLTHLAKESFNCHIEDTVRSFLPHLFSKIRNKTSSAEQAMLIILNAIVEQLNPFLLDETSRLGYWINLHKVKNCLTEVYKSFKSYIKYTYFWINNNFNMEFLLGDEFFPNKEPLPNDEILLNKELENGFSSINSFMEMCDRIAAISPENMREILKNKVFDKKTLEKLLSKETHGYEKVAILLKEPFDAYLKIQKSRKKKDYSKYYS